MKGIEKIRKIIEEANSTKELNLSRCGLTNLSDEMIDELSTKFPDLERLILNQNLLHSLPKNIGKLKSLKFLHLKENEFTGLPKEIGYLKKLTHLYLNTNYLTAIPSQIGNLENLTHINLRFNELSILPASLTNLENLRFLVLAHNLIEQLPKGIDQMFSLKYINLRFNPISKLPNELRNSDRISILHSSSIKENSDNNHDFVFLEVPIEMQSMILKSFEHFKKYASKNLDQELDIQFTTEEGQVRIDFRGNKSKEIISDFEQYIDFVYQKIYKVEEEIEFGEIQEKVKDFVYDNKLDQALNTLQLYFTEKDQEKCNEILLQRSHLKRVKQYQRMGTMEYKDYFIEANKVGSFILQIVNEM